MKPLLSIAVLSLTCAALHARVVINEIFYNAPEDIENLEWIELHNASTAPADLSNWQLTKGVKFKFNNGTVLPPGGFLVLCRNPERFAEFYSSRVFGTFTQKLSNDGERIELVDASGRVVDAVTYSDSTPWPTGADGESGSLERISPEASGEDPWNWRSSPLSADRIRPGGTPGATNAAFSATLPPVVAQVKLLPEFPLPGQPITVEATLRETNGTERLTLLYRFLSAAEEAVEQSLRMTPAGAGRFTGTIPGQAGDRLLRYRVGVRDSSAARFFPDENSPQPSISAYIAAKPAVGKIPLAIVLAPAGSENNQRSRRWRGPRHRDEEPPAAPHRSAFIYFDPEAKKHEVFDFVQVAARPGGWKVRLGKNQSLREMTTLNITFETDRGVLAEPLAYELYRLCGMAAGQSWHVRLSMNGQPLGYHLLFEQPNRAFLRRNLLRDDGNMYKILWYERGIVGQHEKKTNTRDGHDDIVALIQALERASGDAQWEIIRKNFDVKQVATYFAVNTVLSHWDGFFNNYFTYHDVHGTGKWTMYPWDQDQTWGIMNGQPGNVFYEMPLTFGMAGDAPPGGGRQRRGGDRFAFGHGPMWWRPGGYFSSPLLANARFRELFLARTREILDNVYTPEKMNPLIDELSGRLRDEVKLRAKLHGSDGKYELQEFDGIIRDFRTHVTKRREFLLAQPEIKNSVVRFGGN
jgi:hypothetical protein